MNRLLSILTIYFIFSGYLFASGIKQNPKLIKGKLKNGLTYYIFPNAYPKGEAVYRLFIKTGSVNEKDSQKGLAHFIEHMAFNGSEHFKGNQLIHFLESKGAKFGKDLNAHTSFNETVYKLQLPTTDKSLIDSTLTILRDWAGGLLLDSIEIEAERGVIMSEWLSKKGPQADINNALLLELLNNSRFSQRIVIGDTAVIKHFNRNELIDYYQTWYNPELMAVAVVGDVDPHEIENMIISKFGDLKPHKNKVTEYSIPDFNDTKAKIIVNKSLDKVELNIMQLMPLSKPVRNESDYPEYLSFLMLNKLIKARFNALSFENPDYKNADVGISNFLNTKKVLISSVELNPEKTEEGIKLFTSQLKQLFSYGFLSQEIEKQKRIYVNQLKRKVSSKSPVQSDEFMNEIYSDYYNGNVFTTIEEELRLLNKYINNIDSVSMLKLARKLYKPDQTHYILTSFKGSDGVFNSNDSLLTFIGNSLKTQVNAYDKFLSKIPDELLESEPTPGYIVSENLIKDIDAEELVLSNGIKIIFKRSVADKNRISISAFRKGGTYSLDSSDYVTGLFSGNIVGLSGAGRFNRDALSYFLAGNSASVRFLIDKTRSGLVGTANLDDIETLFQLLFLKWNFPQVDTSIFVQTKEKLIQDYITKNITDEDRFYKEFGYLLKKEDYTNRELTDSILKNDLTIDKVLPTFNSCFGKASGYTFIILADCELSEIKNIILKYLGGLAGCDIEQRFVYNGGNVRTTTSSLQQNAGNSPKAIVSLVFQKSKIDTTITLFDLQNEILGEVIKMKLLKTLREEMGMVYSVNVTSGTTLYPSPLSRNTITFRCLPGNVDTLIYKIKHILNDLHNNPQSFETELSDVKANLIKSMQIDRQKDSFWSSFIRNTIYNNEYYWNYISDFNHIVESYTTKKIAGFISEYYDQENIIESKLFPKFNLNKL